MYLFRKISVFQVAARIAHHSNLSRDSILLPLPPTVLRRSHSRGSISSRGHRETSSDAESIAGHYFNSTLVSPTDSHHGSQGSSSGNQLLGGDLHGPGLLHARSAPGPGRSIPSISVEPPTDPYVLEMQWNQNLYQNERPSHSHTFSESSGGYLADWENSASSESAFSNPYSPANQYADFHDDASDHGGDNLISPSNELFDFDLIPEPQRPSGRPDPSSPVPLSPFTHQSVSYGWPYPMDNMSLQDQQSPTHDVPSSPTSGFLLFDGSEMTLPSHPSQRRPAHHSSLSGDSPLFPPSPTALRRTHSRGFISSRGHQYASLSLYEGGVATPATLAAAEKRRKNRAKCQCPQCHASFTAESSRKRHITSHLGKKRFTCSKPGCEQLFSNEDDRQRHEIKSKKHATMYTSRVHVPRPGMKSQLRHNLSCDETSRK
ncbi:hypothetical protein FIBSPDRAFT_935042 [Athelia psychrophila]|uniref:C2H2-type domain-containing protein n=1 Tax=Athelia psychrophila TaxID=1759441 RepID=A0A166EHQ3_9AGAM|nr:hypothetical protein FIBSPDRAFT_935042 [Fibularhizoctonia sp. CBS 109695]